MRLSNTLSDLSDRAERHLITAGIVALAALAWIAHPAEGNETGAEVTLVRMDQQATYDDVNLILKLYELRREERMRKGRNDVARMKQYGSLAELQAACPPGSDADASLRMVTSYWDMAASFVTSGVLNQELFLQSAGELLFVWTKVSDLVPELRKAFNSSRYLSHMETVAKVAIDNMNRANPTAYEAFSKRVKAMGA
jgi:hypothetical protein